MDCLCLPSSYLAVLAASSAAADVFDRPRGDAPRALDFPVGFTLAALPPPPTALSISLARASSRSRVITFSMDRSRNSKGKRWIAGSDVVALAPFVPIHVVPQARYFLDLFKQK